MNFGQALTAMRSEKKVAREGWNGKGMFVEIHKSPYLISRDHELCTSHLFIHIKLSDGTYVPWTPSQTDLLANDWQELET